jgi:glucose/mannose transport system permease protein|uniref:Carbohydrate ABC transporter permease n=1 Tax=Thermodesulfobium narugense TaxID=184064 RepID=A0A7C5KCB6_9BACT
MKAGKFIITFLVIFLAIIWLMPVYLMINIAFKPISEINVGAYISPPSNPASENWLEAFEALKTSLLNSVIVSIPATLIAVFLGSWSGYAIAMYKFAGSKTLFFFIAIVTYLPYLIFLIPLVKLIVSVGLFNNLLGMIFAYVILNFPMALLITSLFFQTLPKELQEAAAVDGCPPITFYFRVLIPVSLPGLTSAAVLTFTNIWNEFIIALSLSQDPLTRLAIPTLAGLRGSYAAQWNILMAGAAIVSIPGIIVLIFLGRFFIKGLTAGAIKE